jgi:hypothetical protein
MMTTAVVMTSIGTDHLIIEMNPLYVAPCVFMSLPDAIGSGPQFRQLAAFKPALERPRPPLKGKGACFPSR